MSADKLEARVSDLEQYFKLLVEMIRRHDERLDGLDAQQSNADVRIAALADAQIRTEAALDRLSERLDQFGAETDGRLNRLADLMERHFKEGHGA
ncbi:MAG TPA: hypothetical protein VF723_17155 [Pyrinomonadaceae bacterium]|jgi:uncharacterized coiled-coil protein SlyX